MMVVLKRRREIEKSFSEYQKSLMTYWRAGSLCEIIVKNMYGVIKILIRFTQRKNMF